MARRERGGSGRQTGREEGRTAGREEGGVERHGGREGGRGVGKEREKEEEAPKEEGGTEAGEVRLQGEAGGFDLGVLVDMGEPRLLQAAELAARHLLL